MRTIYLVFHSHGFYDVPRVLTADARSLQALATILDHVNDRTMSCWYRSDARQDEFRLSQAALLYKVMTMSVVGSQRKHTQIPEIKQ